MSALRAWLDQLVAPVAMQLLRDAVGHDDPIGALRPARPRALPPGSVVAFWSLTAGVGTSTTAALVAHRSSAAGRAPVLLDLDRWAPSLALRAGIDGATLADALLRPTRERELISRWRAVPLLPGSGAIRAAAPERLGALLDSVIADGAAVLDLGAGADALDPGVLARMRTLCVCVGTRAAQLQAAFAAVPLVEATRVRAILVVVGAAPEDAARIAARLPWPLAAAIPDDEHLRNDDFAARAPTLRAIDSLIAALA